MKKIAAFMVVSLLVCLPAIGQVKPCEELKSEIEAKIKENGVPSYTLEIVPMNEEAGDRTQVGTCNGGQNKILYKRGGGN